MLSYRGLTQFLGQLGVRPGGILLAHVAPELPLQIVGGSDTVLGALMACTDGLVMPAFTLRCMVVPRLGPADNGLDYGGQQSISREAEFFGRDLSADTTLGPVAETLRQMSGVKRSVHPLLSFTGWQADEVLQSQTLTDPLAALGALAADDGDVLLLGTGQRANVTLHYAEQQAGRKQFVRWALTPGGVRECARMPGCADGFDALLPRLEGIGRRESLGASQAWLLPMRDLIHTAVSWIRQDPRALLCDREGCACCAAIRASVRLPTSV
jgi:aminoglycoside 3-N-acetyltransferase